MHSWEILEQAIPRTATEKVAGYLHISANHVRRWRREPESDEQPTATGQRSILDRFCELVEVVYLVNPRGPALILHFVEAHHRNLIGLHAKPFDDSSRVALGLDLLDRALASARSLSVTGCTDETLRLLAETRDAVDDAVKRCESTMSQTRER